MNDRTFESKREFVNSVGELLAKDERSGVVRIALLQRNFLEVIEIEFKKSKVYINANWNSNGANFKEIAREVYGEGSKGRMEDYDF